MKILLLGSSGKLGTAIEETCRKRNLECIGLTHSDVEIINKLELEYVINKYQPDVIINAASLVGINQCEDEPKKAFEVNSIAVNHLAKICQEKKNNSNPNQYGGYI